MAADGNKTKRMSRKDYLNAVLTPKMKTARIISFWIFIYIWILVIAGLIIGGIFFLRYCRKIFILYEDSQLKYALEDALDAINTADINELTELLVCDTPLCTEFEDAQSLKSCAYSAIVDATLEAKEVRTYSSSSHRYILYSGDIPVGEFEIVSAGEETRLMLLTITQWEYSGGILYTDFNNNISRSYTVPEGFTVVVNGIALGNDYIDGEPRDIAAFSYVEEYTTMPRMVTYCVTGLYRAPQTVIYDNLGNEVAFDTGASVVILPEKWSQCDVPEELRDEIIFLAQLWSSYTLHDIELGQIKPRLIPDSSLWNIVIGSKGERRYIDGHYLKGYSNVRLSEYTRYTDNCFSCRITMDRTVLVINSNETVTDSIDIIIYFVLLDLSDDNVDNPVWYIADTMTTEN